MSMLVERQGEMLTDIEQNAEYSAGHVQQGNTLVDRAIKQAKATRHVSCPTTMGHIIGSHVVQNV